MMSGSILSKRSLSVVTVKYFGLILLKHLNSIRMCFMVRERLQVRLFGSCSSCRKGNGVLNLYDQFENGLILHLLYMICGSNIFFY